jgi:hypothetical protein
VRPDRRRVDDPWHDSAGLDVGALAQVYLGGFLFVDLAVAGRVRECQSGALLRADPLFTPPRAPYNSTPF